MKTVLKAQPRSCRSESLGARDSSSAQLTPNRFSCLGGSPSSSNIVTPCQGSAGVSKQVSPHVSTSDTTAISTPLWGIWEMWCDFPQKPAKVYHAHTMTEKLAHIQQPNWLDAVKSIGLFDTAEGFWGIHDCTLAPSKLPNGSNYYLFRNNVAPMWEQEANRRGGKWVAQFPYDHGTEVDVAWTNACVAVIGEQLPGDEVEICGICVAKRKSGYKISLWTRSADDAAAQTAIGMSFKQLLTGLGGSSAQLKYLRHCETLEACSPSQQQQRETHASSTQRIISDSGDAAATSIVKIPEPLYVL